MVSHPVLPDARHPSRLRIVVFLLPILLPACAVFRDPEPTATSGAVPTSESWPRLEESWGPGELAAVLTGTFSSKDRNFWVNLPLISWYVRSQDQKGIALLGGAIAYDMVSVERHQGLADSKKMTSVGFLGLAGRLEERKLDGSRGYEKHHWLFPFYRYRNVNGQRTVYPLFIFPVALRDEVHPGPSYDPGALATEIGSPIDPPDVRERAPRIETSRLLDPADPRDSEGWGARRTALERERRSEDFTRDVERAPGDRAAGRWRADGPPESRSDLAPARADASTPPPPEARRAPATYTVQPGDSLFKIARRLYGRGGEWKRIFELNRDQLKSPDRLQDGMVLELPN